FDRVDLPFFKAHLEDFLPDEIVDFHVHVSRLAHFDKISEERRRKHWMLDVSYVLPVPSLFRIYAKLLPSKRVHPLCFPYPIREAHLDKANAYVASEVAAGRISGLYTPSPTMPAAALKDAILSSRYLGLKPYPDLVEGKSEDEISIFDFLPHGHLQVADELSLIVLLHIPRRERLRDPRNIEEIKLIANRYPRVKLVIAHVGRSYCPAYAAFGLPRLSECPSLYFDIAAVLNVETYHILFNEVSADRVLWGSDLPIVLMRGKQECHGDQYVNFVRGDYVWNVNRKLPEVENRYTFFMYEALLALRRGIEQAGLGKDAARQILCENATMLMRSFRS
ncbi:MAG: hypothetical protein FJ278_25200, partial [Planctomycetes bacterium]|nr:hypothetical protein [Planctomycetota bacterium]